MEPLWWLTKDGDVEIYELFQHHYSSTKNRNRRIRQFVGPGENIVLRTLEGDAVFVWRKFINDSGQLSDRLMPLLISSGLVKGIIPTSMRRLSGQRILDFVFSKPDGDDSSSARRD